MKQSGSQLRHSTVQTAKIKCVKFTLLSKEQIERWTVCEVTNTKLYDNKLPAQGGLNDLRMGVNNMMQKCLTCGENKECPGHFGRMKLQEPLYHYGYLKFVEKVIKCICTKCSRLRKPKENDKKKFNAIVKMTNGRKKLIALSKLLLSVNKCERIQSGNGEEIRGCGSSEGVPTKVFVKNYKICVQFPVNKKNKDDPNDEEMNHKTITDKPIEYTAQEIYKILERIDPNDAEMMGFTDSKPVDLILTQLLICPPQVRPSIEMNAEKRAEDAITSVYNRILSFNNELKKPDSRDDYNTKCKTVEVLEKSVASIMKRADRLKEGEGGVRLKIKQGSKAIKSFEDRLKGKEGRFRQHLMGKRVDFSARSVISPDANLALDELGVPEKVAMSLTFPEEVTALNIGRIRKLCEQGKVLYFIKPSQDKKTYDAVDIKNYDFEKELNYGIIVERCLQDGDFVLFNRQPTLHRMSMMGHRVRILPYNTFRLNLSVCTPYNADFDGDEMNMHVPQSYQSLAEIKHIAHVSKQIITPKNNAPVMGIVQDCLLGIYLFTLRDTFLTREQIMNLIIWIEGTDSKEDLDGHLLPGQLPMPAILKPVPLWTGKQVMSMVIPSKISSENYKDKTRDSIFKNIKDVNMIIKKGELITGAMQKETVGSGAGGLIHIIWLEIGPDATNHFITTTQRIVNNWLMQNSFSVGAADIVPTIECIEKIKVEKQNIEKKYEELVEKFRNEQKMKEENLHMRGKTIMESLEFHINEHLNAGLGLCQKIVTSCISPYINNIYKMIFVKSKGNETNLCQIIGLLANQNVDGKRAPEAFQKRSLPHFSKYDMSPEPRGFIYNSFFSGLKSHEFFFHSMGGREGLSDTAVKTARTGYIQRKLIKALEDVIVRYDGTVRDSQNNLVQSLYGEDGFAAEFIEKQNVNYDDSIEKFEEKYRWDGIALGDYKITEDGIDQLEEEYTKLIDGRKKLREIFLKGTIKDVYCPIRIDRLINNVKVKATNEKMDLGPAEVSEEVERLLDVCIHPRFENEYKEILNYEKMLLNNNAEEFLESKQRELNLRKKVFEKESGIELFRIIVRMALASKIICQVHKLSRNGLRAVIEMIKAKFRQSMIHPGEAIGAIAAQCVGEPTTQMTLNTFHSAGIAATNVTLGVPRLQELLDVSKKMKTPSLKIYLKDMIRANNDSAAEDRLQRYILYEIPERHLSDYIVGSKVFYDYKLDGSAIGANSESLLEIQINEGDTSSKKKTPWVLALYFDKEKKIVFSEVWDEVKKAVEDISVKDFEVAEVNSFNDTSNTLQIFLRCYECSESSDDRKKFENKDKTHYDYFRFINEFEYKLRKHRLSGIDKIKKVLKSKEKIPVETEDGVMTDHEYWILQTEGSNLKAILSHAAVDTSKTVSNDMTEILDVLGIEAARMSFINEFRSVLKHYSIYINYRHLATLADWMTRRGSLTPINRNGINRITDVSVLRKASFEETVEILYDAAVFSEVDSLKGISERIIFGDHVDIGTGAFPIMLDRVKVKDFIVQRSDDVKDQLRMETMFTSEEGENTMSTPNIMGTPWGPWGGATNLSMGTPNARAVGFSPNPYANQFMSDFQPNFGSSRSPGPGLAYGVTPMLQASIRGGEYTPNASSPSYNNYTSPFVPRMQSPFPGYGMNSSNMHSPQYQYGSASPVYSSGHQKSIYNSSSRVMQSPRYQSPFSNSHQSQSHYSNSPSYSITTPAQNTKREQDQELDDEDK